MFIPDFSYFSANKVIHDNQEDMEEIFLQALVNRAKTEEGLIDLLPDDIRSQVEQKLAETEVQDAEVITDSGLAE